MQESIEHIVSLAVDFQGPIRSGWNRVFCKVCGDGTHEKGPRGGWLFEGDTCAYNCFNCGIHGNFDPSREIPLTRDMSLIFKSYGIQYKDYAHLIHRKSDGSGKLTEKRTTKRLPEIPFPTYLYPLQEAAKKNKVAQLAYAELDKKCVDPQEYPFYLSKGTASKKDEEDDALLFRNRLVIPVMDGQRLVGLEGKDLTGTSKSKYVIRGEKSSMIHFMDRLRERTTAPLYITEGFFDAYHCFGVACFGNKLSKTQIEALQACDRPKIIIPDRNGDSVKLAETGLDLGWSVSIPDIGSDCKDITEAVAKYGCLYVAKQIRDNVYSGFTGKALLQSLMKSIR